MKYNKGILTLNLRELREILAVIIIHFCIYVIYFPNKINIMWLAILELYIVSTAIENWWDKRQQMAYELELMRLQVEREKLR